METLAPIRELFQDEDLRIRLSKAHSEDEALGLLVAAGAAKEVSFSADSVRRLIDVFASPVIRGPSDKDLKDASGQMMAGTHIHMSCCTDCPPGGGLC
jgi:hypothetical protein